MRSAHGSCSSTTKNLVQYQKQKSLSASPVLRCRCQAGQLGAASGRAAGSWGLALLRPCWGLVWGLGLGKGSGTVRPQGTLRVPSKLGALSFTWLQQVPRGLSKASLCGFKSIYIFMYYIYFRANI